MSEIKVDALTGKTSAGDITVTVGATATQGLQQGLAKHFITYNELQTVTDSLNNSSITDITTGNHRYNFVNNFNAAEAYTSGGVMAWNTDQSTNVYSVQPLNKNDILTSSVEMSTNYAGGTNDYYYNCSTSHGSLA